METYSIDRPKKKRNRVPLSCTICRKRKVKCDKTHPHCQQCIRTGVTHLCHYMEQTWAEEATKTLSKDLEIKRLKDRIKSLENALAKTHLSPGNQSSVGITPESTTNEENTVTLYDNDNDDNEVLNISQNFDILHLKKNGNIYLGATHWLSIMKGDPFLKKIWVQIFSMREKLIVPTQVKQENKCPYHNIKKEEEEEINLPEITTTSKPPAFDELKFQIIRSLPPKDIVQLYLDKFFKHLYPIIPILDESFFKQVIDSILVSDVDVLTVKDLHISHFKDYSHLGILLIILRMTWLSLPLDTNERVCRTTSYKDYKLLSKYEPSSHAIDLMTNNVLKTDEIPNEQISLDIIQFAIFHRWYMICSEVDMDVSMDNETHRKSLGNIVTMAFSCGLHKDPDNFAQLAEVVEGSSMDIEKYKHIWRKIWYYIISMDIRQSVKMGIPRMLKNVKEMSDTKLPSSSKIDYVKDIGELVIVKDYTIVHQMELVVISVLNCFTMKVNRSKLRVLIGCMEDTIHRTQNIMDILNTLVMHGLLNVSEGTIVDDGVVEIPTLEEIMVIPNSVRVYEKHMILRRLLFLLNYMLYTHYEGQDDSSSSNEYEARTLKYALEGYHSSMSMQDNVSIETFAMRQEQFEYGNCAIQFFLCLLVRDKFKTQRLEGEEGHKDLTDKINLYYEMSKKKETGLAKMNKCIEFFMGMLTLVAPDNALWVHPKIRSLPPGYNDSTQYVMDAPREEWKKCPVYQDVVAMDRSASSPATKPRNCPHAAAAAAASAQQQQQPLASDAAMTTNTSAWLEDIPTEILSLLSSATASPSYTTDPAFADILLGDASATTAPLFF